MKSFIEQAQLYAQYHQKNATRSTHMIGVPLIILSLMIFLGFVKIIVPGLFSTSLAFFATIGTLIYYYRLHWQLALILTPVFLILLWIANLFSHYGPTKLGVWVFVITFISGWTLQFYGHYIEGKKPAFMVNISQALIAPLYLAAELMFMAGYMKTLKEQIHSQAEDVVVIQEKVESDSNS